MRFFSLLLSGLITFNPASAQTNDAASAQADLQAPLKLHVVDDPGLALPNSTAIKGFAVQLTDSSGAPVAGAAVSLRLPDDGATGHFANNLRAWVAYSDPAGIARFPVIQWEGSVGLAELRLTAAKGAAHTGLRIKQEIMAERFLEQPASLPTVPSSTVLQVQVPKPAPPPLPQISLQTPKPDALSTPLADVVPQTRHALTPNPTPPAGVPSSGQTGAGAEEPAVTITNSSTKTGGSAGSRKKWLIIAAIGAAAGAGAFIALHGHHTGDSTGSSTGVSIGAPTITVGH
jgi:hypothetical protein